VDVTVEVKGLRELEARLQEIDALGSPKIVRRVLRKIAKPLETRARHGAQSIAKSGALAASVKIVGRRPKGQQVAALAVTSKARERTALFVHNSFYRRQRKGVFYGWMVDQGHQPNVGPRPWFTPAVQASEPDMPSAFVRELTAAIRRIEKRKGITANTDVVTE
jgi:hypothetical protein